MNAIGILQKYFLHFLILIILFDITYSHDNDTSTEGHRHGRVSGRIVKLYSGPKPDPILCLSEGFLADTVDCSVFYRCLKTSNGKYTVYRFQCGPGTVYDPDTEVCNHPRSTKRLECGGLTKDKIVSSTEKYFENEIDGLNKENPELPSPITTKPSKFSNPLSTTITTPKPANSHTTTNFWLSTSKHENGETTKVSTQWDIPTAVPSKNPLDYIHTEATYYVTRQPSVQKGAQCTSDGFMGDDEDCRKFYRCVNNQRGGYIRYEFSCSDSTIWDDDTQGCNHPWAVRRRRCGKGTNYNENSISYIEQIKNNEVTPNNIIQQQTQISYGSKVTQTQKQISTSSAIQNQTQINFGDRLNLVNLNIRQNQTQINYGVPISQTQTQFNYGNELAPSELQIGHSNRFNQTQMLDNILSSTIITPSTPYTKGHSSSRCTKVGFIGDSNDCKKFYRCISNEKGGFAMYEFSCSEGTLWDEQLEACNHASAVKECGTRKSSQNISPIPATIENTTFKYFTTTSSSLNNNEIDELGYGSQNKHELERPRPMSSTVTQATHMSIATTKSSQQYKTTDCSSNGFFGNTNDCAKFYRCVENGNGRFTKYEYKCGDGTVWDPEIESCNHAWSVKSCDTNRINGIQKENIAVQSNADNMVITTVSLIQTTTQKNIPNLDYDSGYQTLHRETPPQSTTTTERIANQRNECKTPGFIGDSDCKKFYRCVENSHGDFTRYEFTCGEGTVWDPEIEACNHAWAVKQCGDSTVKDNPTTSSSSVSQNNTDSDANYNPNQDNNKDPITTMKTTTSKSTTNSVTSVTHNANDCQSNGFVGDDNDCKIFYRCVENGHGGFIRYEFSCGDGTVWDPKISACNHAWAVEKCGGSHSTHEYLSTSTENSNFTTAGISSEISTQHTTSSSTILTSTISDKNNLCLAEGFIGDKHDCKKFYRCVGDGKGNYIRYDFACGEGTVWDPQIQACNHAWAVKSCISNESSDSDSSLTSRPTTMKDEEANNNSATPNQEINGSTENNSWSSSTIKSSTATGDNNECNRDGFIGDTKDCKKFYRCVNDGRGNFIRYEFSCGDGTVWDSEINACNHNNSVKSPCSSLITETIEEKEPNYIAGSSSTPSKSNEYSTTTKEPQKPQMCEQEGFFGDKNDCKKFYRCTDNGQQGFHKYEFTCGEGTIWDQEILGCNHASSNLHCGSVNKETQTENSDLHSTTSTVTSQLTEKTTSQPQTTVNTDECTTEGFYANSNDCKNFFRCVEDGKGGFTKYDFTCGEGTIWVQDIQACDHDSDTSVCSKGTITTTTIAPSHSSQEKPVTTISTSTVKSTIIDSSTSASNTKPTMQDETVSGSSSTSGTTSTTTSGSATSQDRCEEAGYFGNSKNCNMFYRCVDNGKGGYTKYDFTCGDGTIWDQDITACNHPQDVSNLSCENEGSTLTTTTTTKRTTTTTTEMSNETSQPTKGTSSIESTTTESSNTQTQKNPNSNNYTCNEAGFYADPYDCKKFYRCVDWGSDGKTFSIYHFECGEGTIWDPNLQTCNHEESVYPPRDCSGTQTQNENNNTTTTAKQEQTTESSTTERLTTTKQTTTQKSTTQSSTTTELSSTSDQTSTQQSSTSDQTSSTEQSSTQPSTTEQSSTQSSTTEQSSTQSSTTGQSSTQPSTTVQSTTQKSTTEQSTTQKSTTEQSTTQQSTTEQSTTEPNTTQQPTTEQSTTQQSTTEQSTTQQSTTASEQTTAQQSSTSEQTTTTTTEQTTTTTTSNEETTTTTAQPTTSESTTSPTDQTTKSEQSTTQESTEQSSENQSSTTEQSTTQGSMDGSSTTESGQDTTTEQETSDKECPQTDDDQYLFVCPTGFKRHPKYCNLFYQCTEDDDSHEMKVAVFNCPNNTIYDESKTQCVEEEKADKKCDGQIAQRRRVKRLDASYKEPITVGKEKYFCPAAGHFPFEKNEQCSSVLFKCKVSKTGKLRGFIYQCPEGYVYWSISRRCEPVSTMTDCKHSLSNWKGRHEIPIERNNVARTTIK